MAETVAGLANFPGRGAGTNAERRAALWLRDELATAGREAQVQTFWSRPNWALAHAWHAALAVAGSLVALAWPKVGAAVIIVAMLSIALDVATGRSLGRRLTPERASQNVVSPARPGSPTVRLLITANYDAGRMGLSYRGFLRRPAAALRRLLGPVAPGWLGWLTIVCLSVLIVAVLRDRGSTGTALNVAQVVPTAALVLAFAVLIDLASSSFGPGANDNASGVGLALALVRALDVAPPRNLAVEVLLQGSGDGAMTGLQRYLSRHRRQLGGANTIVLGLAPSGDGAPRYWISDGALVPLRFAPRLAALARRAAGPAQGVRPHRGRGVSPALPARRAGLPAITIGALDRNGLVPRSHLPDDLPAAVDDSAGDRMLGFALTLVDVIDAERPGSGAPTPRMPDKATP